MVRPVLRRMPLTASGAAVLALSAAALAHGAGSQDLVLTLAGVWGLSVSAATGAAALAFALRSRRDLREAAGRSATTRLEGVEGRRIATGFAVPRRGWPLVRDLAWRWERPRARVAIEASDDALHERVVSDTRWLGREMERAYEVSDVLGLWRLRGWLVEPRPVLVVPDPGALSAADVSACLASGDLLPHPHGEARGDRVDFRTYTRSDPARLILWKVYARTRELMVRVPEPARTPEARPLVYVLAGAHDAAAAGLGRLLMESGVLGEGARLAADGHPDPVSGNDAVREVLAASSAHRHRGGRDLAAALAHESVAADDPVVLVAPGAPGPWQRAALHQLSRSPGRFLAVVAGDAAPATDEARGWRRLLLRDAAEEGGGAERPVRFGAMLRAARPLAGTGVRVLVADRRSGRVTTFGGEPLPRMDAGAAAAGGA